MTAGSTDYERELLAQGERQTRALEQIRTTVGQINNLLWFLAALALFGVVLWAVTTF